jgi:type I restriction enzyme R subunit
MAVKLRYAETVDYRDYEQRIRKLLDQHIDATGTTPITEEPVNIFDREAFERQLEQVEGAAARADTIAYQLKRTITEIMEQDPAFYRKFSQLIDDTIEAYRQGRIDELEYLTQIEDAREQVETGHDRSLPAKLHRCRDAPAYYGAIRDVLAGYSLDDEWVADMAIHVEELIEKHKVRDWAGNLDVLNRLRQSIDDYLFEAEGQYGITLDGAEMDSIIGQVIEIAKKR